MDSLAFLEATGTPNPHPVYVLHGDEDFLKRRVLALLRSQVLGPAGDDFGLSTHDGDRAAFAAVHDELETLPFLSPRRLVVVENADPFVTRHRASLEKYVAGPAASGVLVLDVKSWPATTRLAKLIDADASISCKALPAYRLPPWCVAWAASRYGKKLAAPAASLLVDLTGPDMGQLDQELAKLAVYVGPADRIDTADVDRLVGSSRAENTWKVFDAIAQGKAGEALAVIDRLLDQGEEPMRILGAFSMQLRRLAQAARLTQRGLPVQAALEQVGVSAYSLKGCEQQMRHLGMRRLERLHDWLLEMDLGLKGSSQLPPRTLLERLVVRLARRNEPVARRG
jgi:DNA polymerase-3 subunit delta